MGFARQPPLHSNTRLLVTAWSVPGVFILRDYFGVKQAGVFTFVPIHPLTQCTNIQMGGQGSSELIRKSCNKEKYLENEQRQLVYSIWKVSCD